MKKISLLIWLMTSFLNGYSQDNFPDSWVGNYKGKLEIYAVDSVALQLKMELNIQKTSIDSLYNWTIIYDFKGQKDIRPYELKRVNTKKGIYQIDEKNSIVIDAFYRNKIFTSFFEVMDTFIIATYTKISDDAIVFEIISAKSKAISTTGSTTLDEEDIPQVKTYPVDGRQRAILHKIPYKK